jgi:hypothetical protein
LKRIKFQSFSLRKGKSNTIKFKKNENEGPGQQEAKKHADSILGRKFLFRKSDHDFVGFATIETITSSHLT